MVARLELSGRVEFVGLQDDVKALLGGSDIFVQPAQREEGFGLSLVEAMAMGLICVTTPSGGMKEIVTDGVDGFISADKTSNQLAIAIVKAIDVVSSERHHEMSANARNTASRFRVSETVRGYRDVYARYS